MSTALRSCAALLAAAALGCAEKAPSVGSFTASPAKIDPGGTAVLSWRVTGADRVELGPGLGEVATSGTLAVAPDDTTLYTLTAVGPGGTAEVSTQITVGEQALARIGSFTATPKQAGPGDAVTLRWEIARADEVTIEPSPGVALRPSDKEVVVRPLATTVYTLSARAVGDAQPATAQVNVRVAPPPALSDFRAPDGTTVARGASVRLTWKSDALGFRLADSAAGTTLDLGQTGRDATGTYTARVRPSASTRYTLTALGPGASATASLEIAVAGPLARQLTYIDPPPGDEAVRLVQEAALPDGGLVLALVAGQDLTAAQGRAVSQLALSLPLDGASPGSRDGAVRVRLDDALATLPGGRWLTASPGFDVDAGVLDPGGEPRAAAALLPRSGRAAGVLLFGLSRKPQEQCARSTAPCAGAVAGEADIPAGTRIARLRLRLVPEGGPGPVFQGTAGRGFRAVIRGLAAAQGGGGFTSDRFAIGRLDAE